MRRLLVLAPVLLAAGCESTTGPAGVSVFSLATAEARWAAHGSASYEIVEGRSCECLPEMIGPVRLEVRVMPSLPPGPATETVGMTYESTGEPVPENYRSSFLTIRQLFALIRAAREAGAYRVAAEFDPVRGYPSRVAIDYDRDLADDEVVYTVTSYEEAAVPQPD